jgi:hypothetical protein
MCVCVEVQRVCTGYGVIPRTWFPSAPFCLSSAFPLLLPLLRRTCQPDIMSGACVVRLLLPCFCPRWLVQARIVSEDNASGSAMRAIAILQELEAEAERNGGKVSLQSSCRDGSVPMHCHQSNHISPMGSWSGACAVLGAFLPIPAPYCQCSSSLLVPAT